MNNFADTMPGTVELFASIGPAALAYLTLWALGSFALATALRARKLRRQEVHA